MTGSSRFESRTGLPKAGPEEIYNFVTDIRNFGQFVSGELADGFRAEKESCSFSISPLGRVNVRLTEKVPYSRVVFTGSAVKSDDFSLSLDIHGGSSGKAEVRVIIDAELNPFFKMMVEKPVMQFLETVVDQMEKFDDWNRVRS